MRPDTIIIYHGVESLKGAGSVEAVAKKAKKGLWGLEPAVPMAEGR